MDDLNFLQICSMWSIEPGSQRHILERHECNVMPLRQTLDQIIGPDFAALAEGYGNQVERISTLISR